MRRVPYSPRVEKWTAPVPGKMLRGRLGVSVAARAAARTAPLVRAGEFRVITSGLSLEQARLARNSPLMARSAARSRDTYRGHLDQHAPPPRTGHLPTRHACARRRGPR